MYNRDSAPTDAFVAKFTYLSPMLDSALSEMREFSKKKQDGIVSATKIRILNRLLSEIREILVHEESLKYLDPLSEEDLPQNSDAVLMLGQYRAALNAFENRNIHRIRGERLWVTQEWIDEYTSEDSGEEEDESDEEHEDDEDDKAQ